MKGYLSNENKIEPPGSSRSPTKPTHSGVIPFEYPTTGLKGETYYELWGELTADKVPLICLHGGPGIPHNYILAMSLIHEDLGIPVLMYDQIGCGKSTRFPEQRGVQSFWSPALFMAELDNVKAHLGITTFDLYGQSWGGMLAGEYAITQPHGLRKLIISNSPADIGSWLQATDEQRAALPSDIQKVLDECESRDGGIESPEYMEATIKFYAKHTCRLTKWPQELLDSFEAVEKDNTVYGTMLGPNEFTCTGSLKTWDIREGLKKVTEKTVPGGLLLLNGFYEAAQDEATEPFFWNTNCKVKWVSFALSSHLPHLEEGDKYMRVIGEFLKQ